MTTASPSESLDLPPQMPSSLGVKSDASAIAVHEEEEGGWGEALKDKFESIGDFANAWKSFALTQNILTTATGFIVGAALTDLINSLVQDMVSPLVASIWASSDVSGFIVLKAGKGFDATNGYASVEAAAADGAVTLNWGRFVSRMIDFVLISFIVFLFYRGIKRLEKQADKIRVAVEVGVAKDVKQKV